MKRIIVLFFIFSIFFSCSETKSEKIIKIFPLNQNDTLLISSAFEACKIFSDYKIEVAEHRKIPDDFITLKKGKRYKALEIIRWLNKEKVTISIGITGEEICIDKKDKHGNIKVPKDKYSDWAVFGLGYLGKSGSVVSYKRLEEGMLRHNRLQKIVIHEIGHNLGLSHCANNCVMNDAAEQIATVDNAPKDFCKHCKGKIN